MPPVICLITPPLGAEPPVRDLVDRIGAAARGGVHLVQIRQPGFDARALASLAEAAVAAVRGTSTRVLVNDRLDVALTSGAHGVHLRGDSMPAARVREAVPRGFLIGQSVHTMEEARASAVDGAVDYLIYGTVFASESKPGARAAGVEALARVCAAVPVPVLAIGGVTLARLGEVAAAGADGFAAIGVFAREASGRLRDLVGQSVRAFDTPRTVP